MNVCNTNIFKIDITSYMYIKLQDIQMWLFELPWIQLLCLISLYTSIDIECESISMW